MKPLPASLAVPARTALGTALALTLLLAGCTPSAPSANTSPSATIRPPAASATAAASPSASPIDTTNWTVSKSKRYGFSIKHPPGWTVIPAERDWTIKADAGKLVSGGLESFVAPAGHLVVAVWSTPAKATPATLEGVATWVEKSCEQDGGDPCPGILDRAVPLCNESDCHSGLLVPDPSNEFFAAFFTGGDHEGQIVGVDVGVGESAEQVAKYGGARRLLEGFLSGMDVCPARPDQTSPGCP